MSKERLYIFDTTLRDGAQTQGVDFSIEDKEKKEKLSLALRKNLKKRKIFQKKNKQKNK